MAKSKSKKKSISEKEEMLFNYLLAYDDYADGMSEENSDNIIKDAIELYNYHYKTNFDKEEYLKKYREHSK